MVAKQYPNDGNVILGKFWVTWISGHQTDGNLVLFRPGLVPTKKSSPQTGPQDFLLLSLNPKSEIQKNPKVGFKLLQTYQSI